MASIWEKMRIEAQADVVKFKGDLDRVNRLLVGAPNNAALLSRRNTIAAFVNSLEEGIAMMLQLEEKDNEQTT